MLPEPFFHSPLKLISILKYSFGHKIVAEGTMLASMRRRVWEVPTVARAWYE
jgi:hypothetical protein